MLVGILTVFIIISNIQQINLTQIFEIPLIKYHKNEVEYYSLYLENYSHKITLSFSTPFNYLSYDFFSEEYPEQSLYPTPISVKKFEFDYYLFYDNIKFKGAKKSVKHYFLTKISQEKSNSSIYKNILSLMYLTSGKNKQYNLIYQMFLQNIISKKQFGFYLKDNKLIIGGIPKRFNVKKYTTIPFTQKVPFESCTIQIKSFSMGDTIKQHFGNNIIYAISLSVSAIEIPEELFSEILNKYFEEFLDYYTDSCYLKRINNLEYGQNTRGDLRLFCMKKITLEIPLVSLGLGNNDVPIYIQRDALWKCNENDDYCLFEVIGKSFSNRMQIGIGFASNYLVMFDYDNTQIELYNIQNNADFIENLYEEEDSITRKKKIYLFGIYLLLIIGFLLIGLELSLKKEIN